MTQNPKYNECLQEVKYGKLHSYTQNAGAQKYINDLQAFWVSNCVVQVNFSSGMGFIATVSQDANILKHKNKIWNLEYI